MDFGEFLADKGRSIRFDIWLIKTLIALPSEIKITGSVVAEQVKTLDLSKRWFSSLDIVLDKDFVDRVTHIISELLSGRR